MVIKTNITGVVMKKARSKKGYIYIHLYDGSQIVTVFDGKEEDSGMFDNIECGQEITLICNAYVDNAFFRVFNVE